MDYLEKKTPNGITLKVLFKKWNFLAFDKSGGAIYADEEQTKYLHKIPVIFFLIKNIQIEKSSESPIHFFRVVNDEIVIPYTDLRDRKRKYLFIKTNKMIDTIPVIIKIFNELAFLVRKKEAEFDPDYIFIDSNITSDDVLIIKKRFPDVIITLTNNGSGKSDEDKDSEGRKNRRAVEELDTKNLNIMSNNPVFLAKVHLRWMAFSKVNQLLLDFDISPLEAEYILKFIESMLERSEESEELKKNQSKLKDLFESFQFYINLLNKKNDEIKEMITKVNDQMTLVSYNTLVAKLKSFQQMEEDQLVFTEYENLLFERKEQIQDQ
ncbi:MAG: hypothetical protein SVZ03_04445 [Spirochaetota bacterium]|nr:hypothetical protein [Spirochaetota bacterium]